MLTQAALVIHTCQRALSAGYGSKSDHIRGAVTAYRDYFADLAAGRKPREEDYPTPVDQLLDALEAALNERLELGLDDMLIPSEYPSQDHLSAAAFAEVLKEFTEAEADGDTISEYLRDIDEIVIYNRRWLRDERGIRTTPNPVRQLPEPLIEVNNEVSDEAFKIQLRRLVAAHPDHPGLVSIFLLNCDEDEFPKRASRFLKPLTDFPAGVLGFYQDEEYINVELARCRLANVREDVDGLYAICEDLLVFGVAPEVIGVVPMSIAALLLERAIAGKGVNPATLLEVPTRRGFPRTTALVTEHYETLVGMALAQVGISGADLGMLSGMLEDFGPIERTASASDLLQVRVDLQGAKPPIWRRLLLPATMPLEDVHRALQIAFDWDGGHLHNFIKGNRYFGPPNPFGMGEVELYDDLRLGDILRKKGDKLTYWYDFGDDWRHVIKLEKMLPLVPGQDEARCVGGRNAAPPEDCGGIWGYEDYLVALREGQKNAYYEDAVYALGEGFDPKEFSVEEVDFNLRRLG